MPKHITTTDASTADLTELTDGSETTLHSHAGGGGSGDMEASTYDPTSVVGDAFDMDNMAEAADAKVLTSAERTILGNTSGINTGDQDLTIPMIILTKSSTVSQNVGGANGTEVYWTWDGETIKDATFTHSTVTNSEQVAVADDGWYEITFIGGAQTTGSSRTTLQGIHKINGGTTSRAGSLRNYTRGASYGNITTGLIYTVQLSADDYIEVGTRVEDSDGSYTINTNGGEISDDCHQLVIKKIR